MKKRAAPAFPDDFRSGEGEGEGKGAAAARAGAGAAADTAAAGREADSGAAPGTSFSMMSLAESFRSGAPTRSSRSISEGVQPRAARRLIASGSRAAAALAYTR